MRKILLAVVMLLKAAEQGHVEAQVRLGRMYFGSKGVSQDYKEAFRWYRKAAEQEHTEAQARIGIMYANGVGTLKDYKEAVKWSRKAAEKGEPLGQYFLGILYLIGEEIMQDDVMAHMWFTIAGVNGYQDAFKKRDSVADKITPSQIQEAQKLAREWMANHP